MPANYKPKWNQIVQDNVLFGNDLLPTVTANGTNDGKGCWWMFEIIFEKKKKNR